MCCTKISLKDDKFLHRIPISFKRNVQILGAEISYEHWACSIIINHIKCTLYTWCTLYSMYIVHLMCHQSSSVMYCNVKNCKYLISTKSTYFHSLQFYQFPISVFTMHFTIVLLKRDEGEPLLVVTLNMPWSIFNKIVCV